MDAFGYVLGGFHVGFKGFLGLSLVFPRVFPRRVGLREDGKGTLQTHRRTRHENGEANSLIFYYIARCFWDHVGRPKAVENRVKCWMHFWRQATWFLVEFLGSPGRSLGRPGQRPGLDPAVHRFPIIKSSNLVSIFEA